MAIGALSTGCDWREFDTLQNQTPVLAVDPPAGLPSSNDFASVILPVAPPADGSVGRLVPDVGDGDDRRRAGEARPPLAGASGLTLTGPALDDLGGQPGDGDGRDPRDREGAPRRADVQRAC